MYITKKKPGLNDLHEGFSPPNASQKLHCSPQVNELLASVLKYYDAWCKTASASHLVSTDAAAKIGYIVAYLPLSQ